MDRVHTYVCMNRMATNPSSKRSRATSEQLQKLADFLIENPGLAGGKFQKLHGKLEHDKKWTELSIVLNSLGGAVKSVEQWKAVWRDLKCRTSTKSRDRKRQQAMTGNKPLTCEPISELEKRVIAIIGNNYIEGHATVSENVPEEEEFQLRLEDEDDSFILEMPPVPISTETSTPKTPVNKTPRRLLKRKRAEEDSDVQLKFLDIAKQQADSLKMLAEANAANVEANNMMAEAIKTMGEGLNNLAEAINNATNLLKW